MNSTKLTAEILARHGARPDLRIWRNETAGVWAGKKVGTTGRGDLILRHARHFKAGLTPGSADLIGIMGVDLHGRHCGRFIALEVKTGTDRPSKQQRDFLALVRSLGGIAGVVRSVADVDALLGPPPGDAPTDGGDL